MTSTDPVTRSVERLSNSSVSVLLPAWNEAAMMGRCLDSLLAIDWPELEVVVCAGGSDGTLEIARRYESEHVIVLEQHPGDGKQRSLRRCFERSGGEIIYLTDADCIVPAHVFVALIDPIREGSEDATTGDSQPLPCHLSHLLIRYQQLIDSLGSQRIGEYSIGLHGRNAGVRRAALENAGSFSWPAPTGTDYALAEELHRCGYRIRHLLDCEVLSVYPSTLREYIAQRSRWLRNLVLLGLHYRRFSLVIPTLLSTMALFSLAIGSFFSLLAVRRLRLPLSIAWLLLGLKRATTSQQVSKQGSTLMTKAMFVFMTPIEVWIRVRTVVQLCVPRERWIW